MTLVFRRAGQARGLLAAAALAALVAVASVAGLAEYNRRAIDAGQRSLLAAAPAAERTLLISGAGGTGYAQRDATVRAGFADGLAGLPVTVAAARYGTGRELTGDLGPARVGDDPVFASLTSLDDLAGHAELTAGGWPAPGSDPVQVTLPERVAASLQVGVGDRIPARDRSSGTASDLLVSGTWRPVDGTDPYWRLAPGGTAADAGSVTSYGPFAMDPADFAAAFPRSFSAAWLIEPDLAAVRPGRLAPVKQAIAEAAVEVPEAAGLGSSATTATSMDELIDRLGRADLVGRSALLTPLLLIVVLGGYALVLVAALLHDDRRAQTALLRARGAGRGQLAGLAVREATLVVLPAVLLAPPLAGLAVRGFDDPSARPGLGGTGWAVALATAVGCLVAMVLPALRRAGTYVADLAVRSRPGRQVAAQRASVDLALVGLALLAWWQLRRYAGPLTGSGGRLGIDPLLATAPILGVLAGAVIALRLLPPGTRFVERFVDRRPWTATVFGMWQAGRRPHAGPVLLLALAVGGSTLAWSLLATWERSQSDQAGHAVGADLRVVERDAAAPVGRAGELADLPGVRRVVPAWRDEVRLGRADLPVTVLALDAAAGPSSTAATEPASPAGPASTDRAGYGVVQMDERLTDGSAVELFQRLVRARGTPLGTGLPAGTRQLTGTVATLGQQAVRPHPVTVSVLVTTADGQAYRLPVAQSDSAGRSTRFTVDLPATGGSPFRLAGFTVEAPPLAPRYRVEIADLGAVGPDGVAAPVRLAGGWVAIDNEEPPRPVVTGATTLTAELALPPAGGVEGWYVTRPSLRYALVPQASAAPVPALLTPGTRAALSLRIGDTVTVALSGVSMPIRVLGELAAVPATGGDAILLDLPAAVDWLVQARGAIRPVPEWWVRVDDGDHATAARQAADLAGVTVADRHQLAATAAGDPYWRAARTGLLAAASGSVLLALVGLAVDLWATGRQRSTEFAVLHTLGATPRLLARTLLTEQAFLAGAGVGVGLLVGALVGATTAPLVIVTPTAGRPVPEPAFELPWLPVGATALGLLLAALVGSALVAAGIRHRVAVARLRIGGDR
ncbi:FtsX-like permease family protein [Micromonospora yangpuensis]|uniref:FtsX-like permease family protein n=1 Tax=Micromonospora yangpuensis TaxID=683228 RepID=A0A1C6UDW1_9ACTN|nr:FtsX-like permease family protein [Micromonospora yangpuensis]GGM27223.1 hypothetical protein GCM10012279_52240 [Micromonospora yangpuensis]SCL52192.1 FtsX-like permease family protein [Micromonospora yangpuensis]